MTGKSFHRLRQIVDVKGNAQIVHINQDSNYPSPVLTITLSYQIGTLKTNRLFTANVLVNSLEYRKLIFAFPSSS